MLGANLTVSLRVVIAKASPGYIGNVGEGLVLAMAPLQKRYKRGPKPPCYQAKLPYGYVVAVPMLPSACE